MADDLTLMKTVGYVNPELKEVRAHDWTLSSMCMADY
jgi:hypothetical protein